MQHHLVSPDGAALSGARATASEAAGHAGVEVRELSKPAETAAAADLFQAIWSAPAQAPPLSAELMRALAATGNYVAGAYVGDTLVGAAVAFFTDETPRTLHSHISGVAEGMQGRSVGFALKLHQRLWALERGIGTIAWTTDPLVRRNAYFNLAKLGATVTEYLPDFYGEMKDGVNAADTSDRLMLTWALATDKVARATAGKPFLVEAQGCALLLAAGRSGEPVAFGPPTAERLYCEIPLNIVRLRASDPVLARAWRSALRDTLGEALRVGYQVAGVSHDGHYVLTGPEA